MWIITMNITLTKMLLFFQGSSQIKRHLLHTARCHPIYPEICHPTHGDDDEATSTNISILLHICSVITYNHWGSCFSWFELKPNSIQPPTNWKSYNLYYLSIHHPIHPSIWCVSFFDEKNFPNKKTWNLPNLVQPPSTHRSPSSPERLRPNCLLPLPLSVPRRRHVSNPTGQRAKPWWNFDVGENGDLKFRL